MLTIAEIEQRIAESGARKRQLQDHLKRCEQTMPLSDQVETKARIKEAFDAQVQAESDRMILREYERLRREPIYASEADGILVTLSLARLLSVSDGL